MKVCSLLETMNQQLSWVFSPSKCVFITQSTDLFVPTPALTRRVLKKKNQQKKSLYPNSHFHPAVEYSQ